jgi:hypothetical protein
MSLRDAVLSRRIIRRSINRAYCSLAGHAALELTSYVLGAALFQRIGTPTRDKRERANDRQGFHLLMLRSDQKNARKVEAVKRCSGACIKRRSK